MGTIVDQKTPHLELPLPHSDNQLADDVERIRLSFALLDTVCGEMRRDLDGKLAAGLAEMDKRLDSGLDGLKKHLAATDGTLDDLALSTSQGMDAVRSRIEEVAEAGATVMTAPTLDGPEFLALGAENVVRISAVPGLRNTDVAWFEVSLTGREDRRIDASADAAEVRYVIPQETGAGVPLTLTVRAVDSLGNRSLPAVLKKVTASSYVIAPVFSAPAEGAMLNPSAIVWELKPFAVAGNAEDTHAATRYRIVDAQGSEVYSSGERTEEDELLRFTAQLPSLRPGKYRLQASFRGHSLGWSGWGERGAAVEGIAEPVVTTPAAGAEISRYLVTIGTAPFSSGMDESHVASRYRIRRADDNTIVYDSGEVADPVRHVVRSLSPEPGGYRIDARHKGSLTGWSGWSEPVAVTIFQPEAFATETAFTYGNHSFTVPDGITGLRVLCVGGGSGGGGYAAHVGGIGGKGGAIVSAEIEVTPGQVIPLSVGAVGSNGANNALSAAQQSNGAAGGTSTFGDWINAGGGTNAARGVGSVKLGENDTLICNLNQTPCASYKSCTSFAEMSRNEWTYDIAFSAGQTGKNGGSGGANGSGGTAGVSGGSGRVYGGYGLGGDGGGGGAGGNGGVSSAGWSGGDGGSGGYGGAGGDGGGKGGNGGAGGGGGRGASATTTNSNGNQFHGDGGSGGSGGAGGRSAAYGGHGGTGGNGGYSADGKNSSGGSGGNGGHGGFYGGCGGNGGHGGNSYSAAYGAAGGAGAAGTAGYGGNGGNGGNAGATGKAKKYGAPGAPGGNGCVVVFF